MQSMSNEHTIPLLSHLVRFIQRRNAARVWNGRNRTGLYSLRGGASPARTRTPSNAPALDAHASTGKDS
eukprot:scaffold237587_cov21-Tisochrysis_lutea.AAC.2